MIKMSDQIEYLWENLLSRQPDLIRATFVALNDSDRKAVLAHLRRMAKETGWQAEQKISAEAAIQALETQSKQVE